MKVLSLTVLLAAALFCAAALIAARAPSAAAAGPCNTANGAVTGTEAELFSSINAWRGSRGLPAMALSAPANKAAQWFAEAMVENGLTGGHIDGYGRDWAGRLLDCGYPPALVGQGSGEAVAAFLSGAGSPAEALSAMTAAQGGHQNGVQAGAPWECGGVGYASNPSGSVKHAWVVVVASAIGVPCPQAVAGGEDPPPTAASVTNTHTPTPTNTPTPTATPSPTPTPRADGAAITLYAGWNLVSLPPGPLPELLHRAAGCFTTVYQQQGAHWLRYSADVPAYARNLTTSNGGVFWIEGTAANCGLIPL